MSVLWNNSAFIFRIVWAVCISRFHINLPGWKNTDSKLSSVCIYLMICWKNLCLFPIFVKNKNNKQPVRFRWTYIITVLMTLQFRKCPEHVNHVNGLMELLFILFDMCAMKIHTNGPAEILRLIYSPSCLDIHAENIAGRWCLWFLKDEWKKWVYN